MKAGRDAGGGQIGDIQRERFVRQHQRGPRLREAEFKLALVLDVIVLERGGEQAENVGFAERADAAGNFDGVGTGEIGPDARRIRGQQAANLRAGENQVLAERRRVAQADGGQRLGGRKNLGQKNAVAAYGRDGEQLKWRRFAGTGI